MGAWGAIIMSFFGAVFGTLTLAMQFDWSGIALGLPFLAFVLVAAAAWRVIRMPGEGIVPDERTGRVIVWSSVGEGIGLFIASNLVINLGRRDLLLPAMALVVGLHFIPIGLTARFRPFLVLGVALIAASLFGFGLRAPANGVTAGFAAATALMAAAVMAVLRDRHSKQRA